MKRIIVILLALLCLLPAASAAADRGGKVIRVFFGPKDITLAPDRDLG